ncbi:MAG TPA: LysE/ArgO family amino acid transporter [Steroidobacteraceae bacterium]|nr:LysE/ArgO family amino acid transporter [Steroidobacteraceae bacterium]
MPISAFTTGFAVSATLIIAIGAQNAFVLRQGLRREHVLIIVAFCVLADLLLIGAGVAGIARVLGQAPHLTLALTAAGTLFLAWYGIRALSRARTASTMDVAESTRRISVRNAVAQAAGFTFLNPHVYLDTVLLIGSIGARQPSDLRFWFVGGAAAASGAWFSTLGFGARLLRPVFRTPRAWQVLDTIIGLTMLALAVSLLVKL